MGRILLKIFVIIWLLVFSPCVYADDASTKRQEADMSREKKLFRNYYGEGSNSVISFCIEGQVFLMVSGNSSNIPSVIQVYEEVNGKVVPRKCK